MIEIRYVPNEFGPFKRHTDVPSTMEYGFYYEAKMKLPFADDERFVRVWLPGSYDFVSPKKYPVLYMADGQNLVDRYLTAYGDWHLDRVIHDMQRQGLPEPILVGIDSPKDELQRSNELNPPYSIRKKVQRNGGPNHPIGNQFLDYIVKELKPLIDATFSTDTRKDATGIGGASMGGIMAWYGFLAYPNVFGFSLCFSAPFFFYSKRDLRRILKLHNPLPRTHGKIFFYVGGADFEAQFTHGVVYMVNQLGLRGFERDQKCFWVDLYGKHHEDYWSKYSKYALRFWLEGLK